MTDRRENGHLSSIVRRDVLRAATAAAGTVAFPLFAQPARYPVRPIRLLVGGPPGAAFDLISRALGQELQAYLGQPIIIENKSAAGGSQSFSETKHAAPDGYTLCILSLSTVRQPLMQAVPYDAIKDFTWISSLAQLRFAVIVAADSPFKTWSDLMTFGRQHPEQVFYGALSGLGNNPHLYAAEVASRENLKWTPVPFRGSPDAMTALLGGQLTFSVDPLMTAAAQEQAGKVRFLAVAGRGRHERWPSVPSLAELGYDTIDNSAMGVGGPAGMPESVVRRLEDACAYAASRKSFSDALSRLLTLPHYMNHKDFTAYAIRSTAEQRDLLGKYGLLK